MNIVYSIGRYWLLIRRTFHKPEKWSVYWKSVFAEIEKLGIGSLGIVIIISVFMGAFIKIQMAY